MTTVAIFVFLLLRLTAGDPAAIIAGDNATSEQVAQKQVRVLVFNSQNTTPDVLAVVAMARAHQVPVVAVTETLAPVGATFQAWQTGQLRSLLRALGG